jgi:drug/metabolite transporter (DMT)-like permease
MIIWGLGGFFSLLILYEFYRDSWSGLKFMILCSVMWGVFCAVLRYLERDHMESISPTFAGKN